MRAEEMRVAIAEACGWKCLAGHDWIRPGNPFESRYTEELPDYLNDLNAMHGAEKILTDFQWCVYADCLFGNAPFLPATRTTTSTRYVIHATAAQRAEAFLRTLGRYQPTGGEKL